MHLKKHIFWFFCIIHLASKRFRCIFYFAFRSVLLLYTPHICEQPVAPVGSILGAFINCDGIQESLNRLVTFWWVIRLRVHLKATDRTKHARPVWFIRLFLIRRDAYWLGLYSVLPPLVLYREQAGEQNCLLWFLSLPSSLSVWSPAFCPVMETQPKELICNTQQDNKYI